MFVFSLKSNKKRIIIMAVLLALIFTALFLTRNSKMPAVNDGGISLRASNAQERIAFLSQFGWKVKEDPVKVEEVIIPQEFNKTYQQYNQLQTTQNFDLSKYAGKTVKKWTYEVENYPGYESENSCIRANLLVYEGAVIGGDISSLEQNGFMHNFDFPENEVNNTEKSVNP
ncbi:MAG: DUF4830 domain-containing protein [Clostridia bacterium]|nr:DUF4830 domain-containing protein [Clostridia bacterium]